MKGEIYDVIIVGGGPAGSTAAYYLSKNKKLKILVVDRHDFPRHKSCGGLLNHLKELKTFENYNKIKKILNKQPTNKIKFYWDTKYAFERKYKALFNQVDRTEFDNLLLGVALKQPNVSFKKFNVEKIARKKKGFVLSSGNKEFFCNALIGVDGWCSTVSKFLGNKMREKNEYALCLEREIICKKKDTSTYIFYFYQKEPGYAWIIPTLKGYYLGLGTVGETKKRVSEYLDDFVKHCKDNKLIPKNYKLGRLFGAPDPITVPKCMLKIVSFCVEMP